MEYATTIKAIEQTIQDQCLGDCNQCKYTRVFANENCPFRVLEYALGIIYRQNADVEHLKCEELLLRKKARLNIFDRIVIEREAKAEAIKEFKAKIHEKLHEAEMHGNFDPVVTAEMFDSVIKEMVGEK